MCRFRHELLERKIRKNITQRKKVFGGTMMIQKGDYRNYQFGRNNETTKENNLECE